MHLEEIYGPEKGAVLLHCVKIENGMKPIIEGYPYLIGEVDYLKKHEMATTFADILDRRWGIGLRDAKLSNEIKKVVHF